MEDWPLNGGTVHFLRKELMDSGMGVDAGNFGGGRLKLRKFTPHNFGLFLKGREDSLHLIIQQIFIECFLCASQPFF